MNLAAVATVVVCALIAAGCGGDDGDDTTTGSGIPGAEQTVDSAVSSCEDAADQLPAAVSSAVGTTCDEVGKTAKGDLKSAGGDVDQAPSKAADSCKQTARKLPSGEARSTVSQLCDSIAGAEQPELDSIATEQAAG